MIKLDRLEIESNTDVMDVSKYLENKMKEHPEYIQELTTGRYLGFYIPVGYENWKFKEFIGEGIRTLILLSPNKEVVLAPHEGLGGYNNKFINAILTRHVY